MTALDVAELRALAQRANNWGRWARWTDQDGASHMRGLFMVGNLAAVIPIGEMWVETDPDDVNPIAECYTPELADFIAAANPTVVLALLAERDALAAKVERVRAVHASYFDLDGRPGYDDTNPAPEDVWRFDRDFRAALNAEAQP